jgi:hypothetical protein
VKPATERLRLAHADKRAVVSRLSE